MYVPDKSCMAAAASSVLENLTNRVHGYADIQSCTKTAISMTGTIPHEGGSTGNLRPLVYEDLLAEYPSKGRKDLVQSLLRDGLTKITDVQVRVLDADLKNNDVL